MPRGPRSRSRKQEKGAGRGSFEYVRTGRSTGSSIVVEQLRLNVQTIKILVTSCLSFSLFPLRSSACSFSSVTCTLRCCFKNIVTRRRGLSAGFAVLIESKRKTLKMGSSWKTMNRKTRYKEERVKERAKNMRVLKLQFRRLDYARIVNTRCSSVLNTSRV